MKPPQAKRQLDRAIDELRRGYNISLKNKDNMVFVQAAEAALGLPGLPATLILSPARAAALGLVGPENAVAVALEKGEESLLTVLIDAPGAMLEARRARPANLLEITALELAKKTGLLPAALLRESGDEQALNLTMDEVTQALKLPPAPLMMSDPATLPLEHAEDARVVTFRDGDGLTHLAVLSGNAQNAEAPLVRLHSSCVTGDLLGSLRCDCGDQLHMALEAIGKSGAGILLYLNQEGRGIGLANKLHTYRLQDQGMDTVEANQALGFAADERDFSLAAQMLKALGVARIRLLTNNPRKQQVLEQQGITITERVPLMAIARGHNSAYLDAKRSKLGHFQNKA